MTEPNPTPPAPGGSRTASEIVSAAERLADEITRAARREADAIRARARGESDRDRAVLGERIGRLGEMAEAMQRQLTQMRSELNALCESLGSAPEQLAAPGPVAASEPMAVPAPVAASEPMAAPAPAAPYVPGAATTPAAPAAEQPGQAEATVSDPEEVAARLVALSMAMNDSPREETARYLREHHKLADLERLLDDVYARAGR